MVDLAELKGIAEKAARRGLDPTPVVEVRLENAVGQDGEEIIRVLVVVPNANFAEVDGTHFLNALVNVRRDMRETGDPRPAIVEYFTPSGSDDDGGS